MPTLNGLVTGLASKPVETTHRPRSVIRSFSGGMKPVAARSANAAAGGLVGGVGGLGGREAGFARRFAVELGVEALSLGLLRPEPDGDGE